MRFGVEGVGSGSGLRFFLRVESFRFRVAVSGSRV